MIISVASYLCGEYITGKSITAWLLIVKDRHPRPHPHIKICIAKKSQKTQHLPPFSRGLLYLCPVNLKKH